MSVLQAVAAPALPRASHTLVLLRAGRYRYALPVDRVVQLTLMVTITPIPELRGVVDGVINVRGKAVPVVDLGRHLDQACIVRRLNTPLLLLRTRGQAVALLVDEIDDVLSCPPDHLVTLDGLLPAGLSAAPVLSGVVLALDGMTLLLDPDHLFSREQAQVLARAAEWLDTRQQGAAPVKDQILSSREPSPP